MVAVEGVRKSGIKANPDGENRMSWFGKANHGGTKRSVGRDSKTGNSWRNSKSAGGSVSLGKRSSDNEARRAAQRDIARGTRDYGDTRKRPR